MKKQQLYDCPACNAPHEATPEGNGQHPFSGLFFTCPKNGRQRLAPYQVIRPV